MPSPPPASGFPSPRPISRRSLRHALNSSPSQAAHQLNAPPQPCAKPVPWFPNEGVHRDSLSKKFSDMEWASLASGPHCAILISSRASSSPTQDQWSRTRVYQFERKLRQDEKEKERAAALWFFAALTAPHPSAASRSEDGPKTRIAVRRGATSRLGGARILRGLAGWARRSAWRSLTGGDKEWTGPSLA